MIQWIGNWVRPGGQQLSIYIEATPKGIPVLVKMEGPDGTLLFFEPCRAQVGSVGRSND